MKLIETWRKDAAREIDALLAVPNPLETFLIEGPNLTIQYANVKNYGDGAVREYLAQEDRDPEQFTWEIDARRLRRRVAEIEPAYLRALNRARREILSFHRRQLPVSWHVTGAYGEITGQHYTSLERVAICLPRDWRFSPAGLMMYLAPARAAKVGLTYLNVPAPAGDNLPDPMLFWIARQWGVEKVYCLPEVCSIFAFSQGTETVPKVDKIIVQGPAAVQAAALMVSQNVGVKFLAGENDTIIVADNTANPAYIAADVVCLTEDPSLRRVVVITPSVVTANEVMEEISKLAGNASDPHRQMLDKTGAIVLTRTLVESIDIVNQHPPKHLNLFVEHQLELLSSISNAGVICLGEDTPAALDTYFASAGNLAPPSPQLRYSSPLEVQDFLKRSSLVFYSKRKLKGISSLMDTLTRQEQLPLHSRSIRIRLG
ncbi:MAG: histidinol dehydrogenase [Candidatus Wallbacteria bacterium]|nr:histidinol dehydrogenase [Candidatus Wallbacteria bacterium]